MADMPELADHVADALLARRLQHHAERYYVHDAREILDAEYDRLFRDLQALEDAHPEFVSADSPTQRVVGAVLAGLQPVRRKRLATAH